MCALGYVNLFPKLPVSVWMDLLPSPLVFLLDRMKYKSSLYVKLSFFYETQVQLSIFVAAKTSTKVFS